MNESLPLPIYDGIIGSGGGGGGDIFNGGQNGIVVIGSNDNTTTVKSAGCIIFEGGMRLQYDEITAPTLGSNYTITDSNYLIEVTNPAVISVTLPDASVRMGKTFIVSKGYPNGTLTVLTQPADKIDGLDTFQLTIEDQRVQMISNGVDWLII